MCLKQSFYYSKWGLQAILSLTVLLDGVFISSNFYTASLPDCTNNLSVLPGCRIGNLMRIPKMCLQQPFYYFECVLQAILSLTVLSNCVSVSSFFDTASLTDYTNIFKVLPGYRIGNLMRISKMCFK